MEASDGVCDAEVAESGTLLLTLYGWAKDIEPWVQKVAARSGQKVDWHYQGGVAHILVLGDPAAAIAAVDELEGELVAVPVPDHHPRKAQYGNVVPRIVRRFSV